MKRPAKFQAKIQCNTFVAIAFFFAWRFKHRFIEKVTINTAQGKEVTYIVFQENKEHCFFETSADGFPNTINKIKKCIANQFKGQNMYFSESKMYSSILSFLAKI